MPLIREIVKLTLVPKTTKAAARLLITDKAGKRRILRLASARDLRLSFDPYHTAVWDGADWRVGGAVTRYKGRELTW